VWKSKEADAVVNLTFLAALNLLWHVDCQSQALIHTNYDKLAVE
jgi:hypothetical protein